MTLLSGNSETEKTIKRTAQDIFFKQGRFGATTQEIADAAGINRTLINYYFRSRNNLFNLLFEEAIEQEEKLRDRILFSETPFKQKIEKYLDESFHTYREFPYLKSYIVQRLNDGQYYKDEQEWNRFFNKFKEEYLAEVKKGRVIEMSPVQFLLNLWSLISFPFAVQPLFRSILRISEEEYADLITARKSVIIKLLFK